MYRYLPVFWFGAASMNDPELKVKETEDLVVIRDKFPKARHHFLVLPKERIANLASLTGNHVPIIEEMTKLGRQIVADHQKEEFRYYPLAFGRIKQNF